MTGITLFKASGPSAPPPEGSTAARRSHRHRKRPKPLRHPGAGLAAVILLGLCAAFFGWQSAAPWWLALGRGEPGTATVTRCDPLDGAPITPEDLAGAGTGAARTTYPCVIFEAAGGRFRVDDVTLLGAGKAGQTEGTQLPARMLSAEHGQAYAASTAGLHLRWLVGLALVVACGAGIAWASGATRLDRPRRRHLAILLSFAGPLLLTAGFYAVSIVG